MRRLSLLAALLLLCVLPASEARPQRSGSGPGLPGPSAGVHGRVHSGAHAGPVQLSGAAANSMAPLTSEWRDESVRRLSGPEEVSLSQSPYAWKPLLSDGRRRTSRYLSTASPTSRSSLNLTTKSAEVSGTLPAGEQLKATDALPAQASLVARRRLLAVENPAPAVDQQLVVQDDSSDGWVLVAVGQSHSPTTPGAISIKDSPSFREFPDQVEDLPTDDPVMSSIQAISTTLLESTPLPRQSPDLSDKTFQESDETSLLEDVTDDPSLAGRRLSPPPQASSVSDDKAWLPVALAVPSKGNRTKVESTQLSPEVKKHPGAQHLDQFVLAQHVNRTGVYVYRPTKSPIITKGGYRPSDHYTASSPSVHYSTTQKPEHYTLSAKPTTNPQHFTFSATLASAPQHNGTPKPTHAQHHQHYHDKPSQGVVSVIKRPVTMHHNSWGLGTPKPQPTVINNYNDPAWYPKPPAPPPPKPQIIIIEDKYPEHVSSTTGAPTGKPESTVKCPNVVISASSNVQNTNSASKEGCGDLNIVIQSSVANTNAAPDAGPAADVVTGPTPIPVIPVTFRPQRPKPTQADSGSSSSSSSTSTSTSSSGGGGFFSTFFSNLLNGTTRFGISFWTGVLLAPVVVLMAVGTILTPWVVPYLLTRRADNSRTFDRVNEAQRRLRAGAARCVTPLAPLGVRAQLGQRTRWSRSRTGPRRCVTAVFPFGPRRTLPEDNVWWKDDGGT